jgi:transcriptional regulator with XRE-family HTH domain
MIEKGLDEATLSERVGVAEQTVRRWVRGEQSPVRSTIRKIADALEVSPGYLIQGEARQNQPSCPQDEVSRFLAQEAGKKGIPLDRVVMLLRAVEDRKKGMSEADKGILASVLDYVSGSLKNGKGDHGGEEVLSDDDI